MQPALKRFRVMAYVVGVMLLVLVCYAMPEKYIWENKQPLRIIGPIHGFLYMLYLLAGIDLATKVRWSIRRTIAVLLAGAIPFFSFVMERKVTHELQAKALV